MGRTPNLSRSWRAPLAAPNSALQQAVVMLTGHREYIRAQFITFLIGSVSTTLWTRSLSFPTQTLIESARSSAGSSDWVDPLAASFSHLPFFSSPTLFIRIFKLYRMRLSRQTAPYHEGLRLSYAWELRDLCYAPCLRLVMVSDDSLHAVTVEALIDAVTVCEKLSHGHWFTASYASEGSASSLVD